MVVPSSPSDNGRPTFRTTTARLRQLAKGERLALTPSTATGRIANRRRHVVLHPGIGHREREDGPRKTEQSRNDPTLA